MKRALWRDMFLAFAVLAFACLLLGGGSRLIATPDEPAKPILPRNGQLSASLTCPPSEQTQVLQAGRQQESRAAAALLCMIAAESVPRPPQTDANGNILRQASYMRAVYQAFALGDGFA